MTTLHCGPVTPSGSGASVVGAAPQWDDNSDATYGQLVLGTGESSRLYAPLDAIPAGATVESASVTLRVFTDDPDGDVWIDAHVAQAGLTDPSVSAGDPPNAVITIPSGTSTVTDALDTLFGATSLTDVFDGEPFLFVNLVTSQTGSVLRVYEAQVDVTLTLPPSITGQQVVVRRQFFQPR